MANQDTDFGAFVAGFMIGGLVGAATALLLAPQSGEETRTVIRDKSIELKDRAATTASEYRTKAEQSIEDIRIQAEKAIEDVRREAELRIEQARTQAGELQERGQVVLETQRSKIEEAIEKGVETVKKTAAKVEGKAAPGEEKAAEA